MTHLADPRAITAPDVPDLPLASERPLVIYHSNCADGFSAAWCFWLRYGDRADFVPGVHQTAPPEVNGRHVYLVDFSYRRPVMAGLLAQAASVTLIDHHKTALDELADLPDLRRFVDQERSGATLAWDFLFPNEPRPLLLAHIEDYDLMRFKLAGTREIQAHVFSNDYNFERWDKLMTANQSDLQGMRAAGAAIEQKHRKDVAALVNVCKRRMVIAGHDVPVASLPFTLADDAAGMMALNEPFAACYWDTAECRTFGLRRAPDGTFDVGAIAAHYGGGGNPKSAGFKVPRDHILARA